MLNKEETENSKRNLIRVLETDPLTSTIDFQYIDVSNVLEYIEQLETKEQKLIEKLEERIKSVEKCYQELIKPYYDEKIKMINTSFMSKKEKEEFINKRNCLLVQKATLEEILSMIRGEENGEM